MITTTELARMINDEPLGIYMKEAYSNIAYQSGLTGVLYRAFLHPKDKSYPTLFGLEVFGHMGIENKKYASYVASEEAVKKMFLRKRADGYFYFARPKEMDRERRFASLGEQVNYLNTIDAYVLEINAISRDMFSLKATGFEYAVFKHPIYGEGIIFNVKKIDANA